MATVTKAVLKTYFEQGDIPTQGQYVDLIDSQFSLGETGTQVIQGTISASAADIEYINLKKLYIPGIGIANNDAPRTGSKVGSTFTVGKSLEVVGDINTTGTISGSNLNSSGHITASGNISSSGTITAVAYGDITASGHISGSATSTGSFGRVEVASKIEHAQDPNTNISFTSDVVQIKANNYQGAKFATTGGNSLGNSTFPTSITGSTISLSGILSSSIAHFTNKVTILGDVTASQGIIATNTENVISSAWSNAGTISVIILQQATFAKPAVEHVNIHVADIRAGRCTLIPYKTNELANAITEEGNVTYNWIIL